MGQSVSAVKEAAVQQNAQAEKAANDSLTALQDMAKLQVQLFRSTVRDDKDLNKINIKKILSDETTIKCSIDMQGDVIAKEIEDTYGKFASGDVAKGIGSVLSIGLKALFGNASGNSNETKKYFITVGKLGYPLRIDMLLYTYSFTSEALIKVTKNVLAVSVIISSVDLVGLDQGDLGSLVTYCYGDATEEVQAGILEKLMKAREDSKKRKEGESQSSELFSVEEEQIKAAIQEIKKNKGFTN